MICMPMPLENNITETSVSVEEITASPSWYDQMNDDEEFQLHQTILQNQMNNQKNDADDSNNDG